MNISAIICAAGMSTRMGHTNKLLMKHKDRTLLNHVVSEVLSTNVYEVIVVVGHEQEKARKALEAFEHNIQVVYNPSYKEGQTSSIQKGIEESSGQIDAYLICLSDMPLIQAEDLNIFISFFEEHGHDQEVISRPTNGKQLGHPVLFSAGFKRDLLTCTDTDGCRSVIRRHQESFLRFETPIDGFYHDIDTLSDYNQLSQYHSKS